jgi:uncharacterized protein (DUF3820 family)
MEKEIFTGDSPMPFGQYAGQPLKSLPAQYLLFLLINKRAGRIENYIEENKAALQKQADKDRKKLNRR